MLSRRTWISGQAGGVGWVHGESRITLTAVATFKVQASEINACLVNFGILTNLLMSGRFDKLKLKPVFI
jgi:hypothetical protein